MTKQQTKTEPRYLREPDVLALFPFARATLHRHVRNGTFPRPVKIGGRCNAWLADEIAEYQAAIIAQREGVAA